MENSAQIENFVTNEMVTTIQTCNLTAPVQQEIDFTGSYDSILNSTFNQQASFFSKCVFGSANLTQISNTISNNVNQDASSTAGGISSEIVTAIMIIVIVGAIAAAAVVVFKAYGANKDPQKDEKKAAYEASQEQEA